MVHKTGKEQAREKGPPCDDPPLVRLANPSPSNYHIRRRKISWFRESSWMSKWEGDGEGVALH